MRIICIACNKPYFYQLDDEDCTSFLCSYCLTSDPNKMAGKWARLRLKILARDEFTCRYCGDSPLKDKSCSLHIDHVIPRRVSINNSEHNLITSCAQCNYGKMGHELPENAIKKVKEYLKSEEAKRRMQNGNNQEFKETGNDQMENS